MMRLVCQGIFLFTQYLWASVIGMECPYEECSCIQTQIMCTELGLIAMPRVLNLDNTYFQSAYFDGNPLTVIPSGRLPANLTRLSFMETPIEVIEDEAFVDSANTLTTLALSSVRFTRIPDAFLRLNALQDLTLSNCMIVDWNIEAMKHIGMTLDSYFTQNIVLSSWPPWVTYTPKLTMLGLSGCSLREIPDDGLDSLVGSLINLILDNNNFTEIPKTVSRLAVVTSISLDNNRISNVTWLPVNGHLQSLSLNRNKLTDAGQLSFVLRPHNNTLQDLDIQDNLLPAIPSLDFLTHVRDLDFTNNRLTDSNSGSLPVGLKDLNLVENSLPHIPRLISTLKLVTVLKLSHNSLIQLEGASFPPYTRRVEVDYNFIPEVGDASFPNSPSITTIMLNNNPLVTISENAFRNVPNLVDLNLQHTKLTRLPLALLSLNRAESINLSKTESLVCTCLEKSFRDWIMSRPVEVLKGECGQTSIHYFFSVLSTGCP